MPLARSVSSFGRIIERSSMESPYPRKRKTRHRRVLLNMVPGLGIVVCVNHMK
jgi:hypothetical protein